MAQPIESLLDRLGLDKTDEELLRQAFVHRSFHNENPGAVTGHNERLEFLGDSVLGFLVADELFRRFPEADEGRLTHLRSALVRAATLARVSQNLDLGQWLRLGRGEEAAGGRDRQQILAALFEAVLGAVFLAHGLNEARTFLLRHLADEFELLAAVGPIKDHKSRLQELSQFHWQVTPLYYTSGSIGPEHAKEFIVQVRAGDRVVGEGRGRSKQIAEQAAAKVAIETHFGGEETVGVPPIA